MLCLIRTKACKRCGGDLSLERDTYGTYAACIQCGATWSEAEMHPRAQAATERQIVETAETASVCR